MSILSKTGKILAGSAVALSVTASAAFAETVIRIQSVLPAKADEVFMLNEFAQDVNDLTNGEIKFEVLPDGAVAEKNNILDAVDKGLVEAGFAWTHYWSGKHPAAMLFGSPVAGAGVGLDDLKVSGEDLGEVAVGGVEVEQQDGTVRPAPLHVDVGLYGVAVVADPADSGAGLFALVIEQNRRWQ